MGRPRVTPHDRPVPGRRPRDGSRALARLVRQHKIDWRTGPAKALKAISAALLADWPVSVDQIPAAARLLIDRTGPIAVQLLLREQHMLRAAAAGRLEFDDNEKWLVALLNCFRRNLEAIEEMRRASGGGDHAPSLEDFLRNREASASSGRTVDHAETPTGATKAPESET